MPVVRLLRISSFLCAVLVAACPLHAQQERFRWIDFHGEQDQSTVTWVTRALDGEKWTAIREIGVQYDAALVVTTLRSNMQVSPATDTFNIWSVSLTTHLVTPILKGANLRWLDWMYFINGEPPEPTALYDSCGACAADTYFTAFHYDLKSRTWAARWMRGGQAAPIYTANTPPGVAWTEVYAVMTDGTGRAELATWNYFDYGPLKAPGDFVYRYDVDPASRLERTQLLTSADAAYMKQKLCRARDAIPGLARGQNSALCSSILVPVKERKPVTTPPPNNRGQSNPIKRH